MEDFNLDFFVEELKASFNHKKDRLVFDLHILHVVNQDADITWLNGDDPEISAIVKGIVRNSAKRREFEQKQELMLCEDADTLQGTVKVRLFLAIINWYGGQHIVLSDWSDGVRMLLKSMELLDTCRGLVEHAIWQQAGSAKKEQASHGAKAKAALFAPLKAEVIRLLHDRQPEDGWKNKNAAIEAIDEHICAFIEHYGFPGSSGKQNRVNNQDEQFARIPRLVSDWSRNDSRVKAAFDATVKQKKKSAPKGAE
ncbi:hypothetical protein [Enterobacter ludwigii]|uniref:hypothetical protein n=1 Tax=Enterobacter ludwigii TaxID=299767 RepID=UPI0018682CA2|nr:hypothetical protein [Enterobacter ludwigii]